MGLGRKIGKGFLKVAEQGQKVDEGLNKLLGDDRTRPGDGFSSSNTRAKLPSMSEKDSSDKLDVMGKNKSSKSKDKGDFY